MTTPIPTVEPQQLRAGTTWQWRREDLVADYPASAWMLKYALKNSAQHFEITATADGDMFAIDVPAVGTGSNSGVVAGSYRMVGYVENVGPTQRYEVYNEEIVIDPSYASSSAIDDRSHARKVLEAIESVIEGRASKDQEEYTIGHRMLKHTPLMQLYAFRQQYQSQVRAEEQAERAARGQGGAKIVYRL